MPISSPVSSKIVVAPAATSRSKAWPIAGLAVRPLVASEPPQMVPTISSSTRIGTRARGLELGQRLVDPGAARGDGPARAAGVLDDEQRHRPAAGRKCVRPSWRLFMPSQPSDTSSAAPTLGCVHSFSSIVSA